MPLTLVRLLCAITASTLLVMLLPATAGAARLPVEDYPTYQPQTRCSPKPKPGTVRLAEHLLARYPGSGSSGISRPCAGSAVSEHKEGRAFDWRLSTASQRDRGYARDFLDRILSADRHGNRQALARRMGIMYVIWNDRIWSGAEGYRSRRYLHSACTDVADCPPGLRHRDHMHISLTRTAARARTSWYVHREKEAPGRDAEPAPEPVVAPEPQPVRDTDRRARRITADGFLHLQRGELVRVVVPVDGSVMTTRFKLRRGTSYTVTAAGLYSYGGPSRVGDPVCTWSEGRWTARGTRRGLLVNGRRIFDRRCRTGSHTYRTRYTATADRPLKLTVPGRQRSSRGALTFVISRAAAVAGVLPSYPELRPPPARVTTGPSGYGLLSESLTLDAGRGALTVGGLARRTTYRVTVSGVARLGKGVLTNGQCVSMGGKWYRRASIDLRTPGEDHGNLYLNGVPFEGRPTTPGGGCTAHSYRADLTAEVTGRMRLELWDPHDRADNTGALAVRVQRLTPLREPRPARREAPRPRTERWQQTRDGFDVPADRGSGTRSAMRLRKGERVRIVARGTYRSPGRVADATCVRTATGWTPRDDSHLLAQDPLELWVDGRSVAWRSLGDSGACDGSGHAYVTRFTAGKSGPLRLAVLDLDHRDNAGAVRVTLVREKP